MLGTEGNNEGSPLSPASPRRGKGVSLAGGPSLSATRMKSIDQEVKERVKDRPTNSTSFRDRMLAMRSNQGGQRQKKGSWSVVAHLESREPTRPRPHPRRT